MNSIRQKLRPKHQVLVLKCYPKFHKGSGADAKPNSSELSYLLYYASTRRSKLQKVCDFLEKKTASDVYNQRLKNVQVTLQVLQAIIKRCPRDLPLFRGAILNAIRTILKSNDITMVEGTIPTFEALCEHQESATLAADQDYIAQYEVIVNLYADFATKDVSVGRKPISLPIATRFRKAGLEAIRAVSSSDSLGSETARQLAAIIPAILLNIDSDDDNYVAQLEAREEEKEVTEKEQGLRRRNSISLAKTEENEKDAVAAASTTAEADKIAEAEVGIVALQALRNIFKAVNRGQLRLATSSVLAYVTARARSLDLITKPHVAGIAYRTWPIVLFERICTWTPVQDRFVVLVSAVEALIRSPIVENDLEKQVVLASIVQSLLASSISFIGLSVMDVLIGFIQHMLLLLQLGGSTTNLRPHHQQADAFPTVKEAVNNTSVKSPAKTSGSVVMEIASEPSEVRRLLLNKLQKSIGALATHVYYVDQISDMVSTILTRLKPSASSGIASPAAAIEDPAGTADAIASSINIQERQGPGVFFSFDTARVTAMAAIKDILLIANSRKAGGPAGAVGRNSVGVEVWTGTEWLLRDPNHLVREAYVEALLTWLELETNRSSLRMAIRRGSSQHRNTNGANLVKRAVSNASHRDQSPKPVRSKFLPFLHLAIYENAHQYVDSEANIQILHLLLATLVKKLGINAVRYGLPMILRLQEDISTSTDLTTRVHLGSLVHGYLWALSSQFEFQNSAVGNAIQNEIGRRNQSGLWGKAIRVPPSSLDSIRTNAQRTSSLPVFKGTGEPQFMPFEDKVALVDAISRGYSDTLRSPPSSPPGSPNRSFSAPILVTPMSKSTEDELSTDVREQLLSEWSRDTCAATPGKDSDSSASMSGSKAATSATKNLLAVNIPGANMNMSDLDVAAPKRNSRRPNSAGHGLVSGPRSPQRRSHTASPNDSSSQRSTMRVEDLKRALSGRHNVAFSLRERHSVEEPADSESDSMMSADFSVSDISFVSARGSPNEIDNQKQPPLPISNDSVARDMQPGSTIPPVPPIPASLQVAGNPTVPRSNSQTQRPTTAPGSDRNGANGADPGFNKARSLKHSVRSSKAKDLNSHTALKADFSSLLNGISDDGDEPQNMAVKPPY